MTKKKVLSTAEKEFIKNKCNEFLKANNLAIVTVPDYPAYGDCSAPESYDIYIIPEEHKYELSCFIRKNGVFISSS